MHDYRYSALAGTVTDRWEDAGTPRPVRLRAICAYAVTALLAAAFIYVTGLALGAFTIPAAPAAPVMPVAAVCTFDGGGVSVAGSVTRTSDSRAWLCTDDGALVPWHGTIARP